MGARQELEQQRGALMLPNASRAHTPWPLIAMESPTQAAPTKDWPEFFDRSSDAVHPPLQLVGTIATR